MPDFALRSGIAKVASEGDNSADSGGVSYSASNGSKSSYNEVVASSPFSASGLIVIVAHPGANGDSITDVAVGAAASEQIIVPDLILTGSRGVANAWHIPIPTPEGSRIAVRTASSAGNAMEVAVMLLGRSLAEPSSFSRMTSHGANAGDGGGTQIDPGSTADTKGAWTEMDATTANPMKMLALGIGGQGNFAITAHEQLVDIGIGAAGSEQVVVPDFLIQGGQGVDVMAPFFSTWFPIAVPEGSRLAVRSQCSITDSTDRTYDAILYGLD